MAERTPIPARFGKYELTARLARGGMAETFRAQLKGAAGVTKQVVIKKVLPHLAEDEAFVTAFINEAKLSASLSHGNIAQVFDFGRVEGDYFIAMELVDGRSLAQVLERASTVGFAKLPVPIACFLAMEVLKGLHYAHTRVGDDGKPLSLVHRDVSPENVLVSFEGQTKVVDFGVAKAALRGRAETEPGLVKGKFLFFSPEQACAEPLDARSDVFAVGVILYRMLCGELPFAGQMHTVMRAIVSGQFKPAAVVNPQLPSALASVLAKAMAVERTQRFASALEMQEAIASFLYRQEPTFSGETVKEWMIWLFAPELEADGRSTSLSSRFEKQLQKWDPQTGVTAPSVQAITRSSHSPLAKNPRTLAWIAVGVALAGVGVGIGWGMFSSPDDALANAQKTTPVAKLRPAKAPAAAEDWNPTDLLERANAAIEDLDWDKADAILASCNGIGRPCPESAMVRARVSFERRYMEALKSAEAALEEGDLAWAQRDLEVARPSQLLVRRHALVEKRFKEATARAPSAKPAPITTLVSDIRPTAPAPAVDPSVALFEEAKRLFKEKQFPAAKSQLEKCIKANSKNYDCHKLLGTTWAKLGEAQKGAREYREFLRLAPSDHADLEKVRQILDAFEKQR